MSKIYATTNPEKCPREARNEQRTRVIGAQGMVLLGNNGVLPLNPCKIALYGNGARNTIKGGAGSGGVDVRESKNVEKGLTDAGFTVLTKSWLDRYDAKSAEVKAEGERERSQVSLENFGQVMQIFLKLLNGVQAIPIEPQDLPKDCETAIYVVARNSSEGFDRMKEPGDFELNDTEKQNILLLTKTYAHVIVLLNVGGVIDTRFLRETKGIDAILLMSQVGMLTGDALSDVLTGKVTPSGRLTTTWAEKYEDYPSAATFAAQNGDTDDEDYSEGIYVGYRYFDSFNVTPAYPFGYGLGYTTFDVKARSVTVKDDQISVQAAVTNTGDTYTGREVVQVYASQPTGSVEKPYQVLVGFAKTKELQPGESQTVEITFPAERMAAYSEAKAAWLLEKGDYILRVGMHSRNTHIAAVLRLEADAVTQQLKNQFALDKELKQLSCEGVKPYGYAEESAELAEAPVLALEAAAIPCQKATYTERNPELPKANTDEIIILRDVRAGRHTLEELVSQLTAEEMAKLCVGSYRAAGVDGPVIGSFAMRVPGAAGETTSALEESRGIPPMELADGPAGLRLQTVFHVDGNGKVCLEPSPVLAMFLGLKEIPPLPADAVKHYQYPSAIPIATALAQTWDMAAVEEAGDIVGEEMKELGVQLWLAPGMNIHRNPLCGRNFEYYAEDPLLAGLCAAADTRGVQKRGGVGTTIKHFCLNNQEDNRGNVNAHASERAIREIYLKGFEIAVKESQPLAIMTSYNLVNGIHTANRCDLITSVARDEWGFQGLVMTDWGTTGDDKPSDKKYGSSDPAACIKAGNDLIMPGGQRDVEIILKSLNAEKGAVAAPITLGDLQACALRILQVLVNSSACEA